MIDARKLQLRLGVGQDGIAGRGTFAALFRKAGASDDRAAELGIAAAVHFPSFGILDSPLRLAHFMAQLIHETGGFHYMEEIWGPTPAQARYEGRDDLGNDQPGDGLRFKGRGPIQVTGRANYRRYGNLIGIGLEQHPEVAAIPSIGLHVALVYWKDRNINVAADADDVEAVTRKINGGVNGLADRKAALTRMKALIL